MQGACAEDEVVAVGAWKGLVARGLEDARGRMSDPLKILVVDGDEVDRLRVSRALRAGPWHAEVVEAGAGGDATALLKSEEFDCAVLDYDLPGGNGLEVLRDVRRAGVMTPIIVLTGQGDDQIAAEMMKAGASDYLAKGQLPLDHLARSVHSAVRIHLAERAAALANALLMQSESRFRNMADSAPVLLWVSDDRGGFTYTNESWLRFTGRSMAEELGYGWAEGIHEEDASRFLTMYREHLDSRTPFEMEYRFRRHDGQYRWVLNRASPCILVDGSFAGFVGSCIDISTRKESELQHAQLLEREQAARAHAEAANRAKDEFLAVLSHELRTPLTPVLGVVHLLEHEESLNADLREQVAMIRRNVELEARLIDDLLDLTRLSQGRINLNMESGDANTAIHGAVSLWRDEIQTKRLHLEMDLHAEHHHVKADLARLQQVLWNLLKNAVKFTPSGGRIVFRTHNIDGACPCPATGDRAMATTVPQGGEGDKPLLAISVEDTGIGIHPELLPRIFDAFEQGEGAMRRQFGGVGLGLSISRALIRAHGGDILAASAGPGRGATLSVWLATVDPQAKAKSQPNKSNVPTRHAGRILLVDDHADTSRALKRLLQRLGYEIETADSVKSALTHARAHSFDLLISDIGLPDGSGLDLMREIQGIQKIRGIAVSGFGMDEDIRRSKEVGFEEHLTKPINFQRLQSVIHELVR